VAACPCQAIELAHSTREQMMASIDALFEESPRGRSCHA
jgi:heterodisulfide reductase subunit A-like polyferredoxin